QGRLSFTSTAADLARCDMVYIAADTPTDEMDVSDLTPIRAQVDMVEGVLSAAAVLVVLSQVPPGFTRSLARPAPQRFYQVATLFCGRVVGRSLFQERYIVVCADPKAPFPQSLAAFLSAFNSPILPMRYESADPAKISINMCRVASISTANTLAELCEKIGAD